MTNEYIKKALGIGKYSANWIGRSRLVRLTATGVLPCLNYSAQLERRPDRVVPPSWDMVFYVEDLCLRGLKPFSVEAVFPNTNGADAIIVVDAMGEQQVPIGFDIAQANPDQFGRLQCCADNDEYIVYGRLPKPDSGHQGCIVVPADAIVLAIYYRAFGPASKAECDAFALKNCTAAAVFAGGDNVPWPLAE